MLHSTRTRRAAVLVPILALIPVATGLVPDRGAQPPEPANRDASEVAARIVTASLLDGQAYDHLASLVAAAPHRLSGSPGAAAAVEWARKRMTKIGFDEVRLEPCTVPHWERGEVQSVRLTAPASVTGVELRCLALGGSVPSPEGGIEAEVIAISSWDELAQRSADVAGKIVYFNRPFDLALRSTFEGYGGAVDQRSRGAVEAAKAGAVGVVIRSVASAIDDFPHTGGTNYQDGVTRIPAAAISTLAAERLDALVARGPVRLNLELDCRWHGDAPSFNVVGDLLGTESPEEIVVVGAHLDGWDVGHGAHDDGSGCAHALEVVRLLLDLDLRPRRTVRVVLFMNEENGLAGARAYARDHADELDRHVFAIESDRGGFTPRGFSTNAGDEALAVLRELAAPLDEIDAGSVDPGGTGADISQMAASGVPLAGFLPDGARYFAYHHTENDTLDKVSERELRLGAAAIAVLVHAVADREQPLPRNR
ncbi:M20/M25/M40 family metallo-hydrolase [Engelhardtia mirabilis]|uniref:Carboxypeptidase Q n=1 Tax=Engelhardtia mirabilis TaxID=2528011 RepID=A0A518BJF3_9BACT|nr:Bacterial leucyl aminopeptidase precursor [Planctomycetes bacterium Pla133]QDV01446.1 Bacterial leucyl aminopeptidase precursor [Planctomycetes bacterium Pla86]